MMCTFLYNREKCIPLQLSHCTLLNRLISQGFNGTGRYYVDYLNARCVEDCKEDDVAPNGGICGGLVKEGWVDLHDTSRICCEAKLPYLDAEFCVDNSGIGGYNGTGEYYSKGGGGVVDARCVRDCEEGEAEVSFCPIIFLGTLGALGL